MLQTITHLREKQSYKQTYQQWHWWSLLRAFFFHLLLLSLLQSTQSLKRSNLTGSKLLLMAAFLMQHQHVSDRHTLYCLVIVLPFENNTKYKCVTYLHLKRMNQTSVAIFKIFYKAKVKLHPMQPKEHVFQETKMMK